jgi:hypothetical protein
LEPKRCDSNNETFEENLETNPGVFFTVETIKSEDIE